MSRKAAVLMKALSSSFCLVLTPFAGEGGPFELTEITDLLTTLRNSIELKNFHIKVKRQVDNEKRIYLR